MAGPTRIPAEWFDEPDWLQSWTDLEAPIVQIGPDGRVAVLVAPYEVCMQDGTDECWTAPTSSTDYGWAHAVSAPVYANGAETVMAASVVPLTSGHAPKPFTMRQAVDFHSETMERAALVRFYDRPDLGGIVGFGAVAPTVTDEQLATFQASALSGDWRWVPELGAYDMSGAVAVNTPAFRRPRRASVTWYAMKEEGSVCLMPKVCSCNDPRLAATSDTDDDAPVDARVVDEHAVEGLREHLDTLQATVAELVVTVNGLAAEFAVVRDRMAEDMRGELADG